MVMVMPKIIRPEIRYQSPKGVSKALDIIRNPPLRVALCRIAFKEKISKTWFSSGNHYDVYKTYFRGYPYEIWVSPNYLFIRTFTPVITSLNRARYYWSDHERKRALNDIEGYVDEWVIGVNSDGKLFINHINRHYGQRLSSVADIDNPVDGVAVIKPRLNIIDDDVVRHDVLAYHIDVAESEMITLIESGVYRVQGEIVFDYNVMDIDNLAAYIAERFVDAYLGEINRLINMYIYMRIRDWLMGFGIATVLHQDITRNHFAIVVPECATRHYADMIENVSGRIANEIAKLFRNELLPEGSDRLWVESRFVERRFSRYADLVIRIHNAVFKAYHDVYDYVKRKVKEQVMGFIESKTFKTYTVYRGNHIIRIESIPLEYSVEIPEELNPLARYYPEESIAISGTLRNDRMFYILPGFKATVEHNEHGVATVEFRNPGRVEIGDTHASQLYTSMMDRIGIKKLIEHITKGDGNAQATNG